MGIQWGFTDLHFSESFIYKGMMPYDHSPSPRRPIILLAIDVNRLIWDNPAVSVKLLRIKTNKDNHKWIVMAQHMGVSGCAG